MRSPLPLHLLLAATAFVGIAAASSLGALRTAPADARPAPHPFCGMVEKGERRQVCRQYCDRGRVVGATYSPAADMLFCSCGYGDVRVSLQCR